MVHVSDYTAEISGGEDAIYSICERLIQSSTALTHIFLPLYRNWYLTKDPALLRLVLEFETSPEMSWHDVYVLRQVQAFYSKRESLPGFTVDKRGAALASFYESERRCRATNKFLDAGGNWRVKSLLATAARKISRVLGVAPSVFELVGDFGPGATVGVSKNTSPRFKMGANVTATKGAASQFSRVAFQFPHWPGLLKPQATLGGYWTSVPKTYKTDRGIVVEPTLNSFLQKAVGAWIRDKLLLVGLDTRDQTRNQRLALIGSRTGAFATIDLSSASDTVARVLVRELLPPDWYDLLCDLRSPYTRMPDGKWVFNEKFSSMGNGFTFELETLIFWAIASSVSEGVCSVYGDDIIVENEYFDVVCTALTDCGFVVNNSKSFGSGPFRESCGKDYWGGCEVRPVYLRQSLSVKELFRLHNWAVRSGYMDPTWFLELIPRNMRIFGPDGLGDGHLIDPDYRRAFDKRGWECYEFSSYVACPRIVKTPCRSDFGAFLYLSGSDFLKRRTTDAPDVVIDSVVASISMYQERPFSPRYKRRKLRTCG